MTDFCLDVTGLDTGLLVLLITLKSFFKKNSIFDCGYTIENNCLCRERGNGHVFTKNTMLTLISRKSNKCSWFNLCPIRLLPMEAHLRSGELRSTWRGWAGAHRITFWLLAVRKAHVTKKLNVSGNHNSDRNPESVTWNSNIIHFIISICAFPAMVPSLSEKVTSL